MKWIAWLLCAGLYVGTTQAAGAAEICGNGKDDDGNSLTDEGCYAPLRTGVCESPLSCGATGWVSWSTGSLHYALPPDVAPKSPYGPDIPFRRFYTSMYSPGTTPSAVNRTPLGSRWQHNYMSWITPTGGGNFVIHTPQGDDLMAYPASPNNPGVHPLQPSKGPYFSLREHSNGGVIEYELRTKTGEALIYNGAGRLSEIHDTVAPPVTNKVRIAWTSNASTGGWVVDTVSDATLKRRLSFNYSGGRLFEVRFQLSVAGIWTTLHRTTYGYAAGNLASASIGGQLAQTNVYTNGFLTQILDGDSKQIVAFQYSPTTAGETRLIDTEDGTLGFDFDSDRATCDSDNQTVLYFNKANANSCTTDGGCGSGSLCSGKPGSPGACFRAARCLTHSASGEGLVSSVHALGSGSEPCTGACAEVTGYAWGSPVPLDPKALDLAATGDAGGGFTTVKYANGMPVQINYADINSDPNDGGGARTVYLSYFSDPPGRLAEIRRASNLSLVVGSNCSATELSGCAQTLFHYDVVTGKLARTIQNGFTLDGAGEPIAFSYTTTRTYDAEGRLKSVDGPLAGPEEYDVTTYTYHDAPSDPLIHGFLKSRSRQVTGEPDWRTLTEYVNAYDKFGNAIDWLEADGTRSCRTYDAARNYLKTASEKMGDPGNASCAEQDTDIIERFKRDSALRLTEARSADDSCVLYEYDGKGRLARTKRRDDCELSSPGDREEYTYDHDGLLTGVDTYNAAGAVTHKAMASYHDSRRRQASINPVDATTRSFSYDERGVLTTIDDEGGLGKTTFSVDADYRTTRITEDRTPSTAALWDLTSSWLGQPESVKDPDGKVLENLYDDLGRLVSSKTSTNTFTPLNRIHTSTDPMQQRRFSYDFLGRLVYADLDGCFSTGMPQLINYWDENPFCTIPDGCKNTQGRLAGTSVTLMCDGPGEVRQMTSYSYDAAGRVVTEHISDNNNPPRNVSQNYAWTMGGQLAQVTLPSSTVLGWTYGSTTSNSDTDLLTSQWRRTSPTTPVEPVTERILWNPYGPLKQYDRKDVISGSALRMRYEYNLAYRPRALALEGQTLGGPYYSLTLAEDAKGRITKRDYFPSDESNPPLTGIFDSHFLYDRQDHVQCETTTPVTNCQSAASNVVKNSFPDGLTGAGDRTNLLRPIPGTVNGMNNLFKFAFGNHKIASVDQSVLGRSTYHHDDRGNRRLEGGGSLATHAQRQYTYDVRGNLVGVSGTYPVGLGWNFYSMRSAFDGRNRRVYKSFKDLATGKEKRWFFYYDALDRLTEVHYHHDSVVTTYQLFWLDDLLTAYWQTESSGGSPIKRYVESDETGRPVRMRRWDTGTSQLDWAINPDAWGMDRVVIGQDVFQPIVFAGQYRDSETATYLDDRVTPHRPGLVLNGFRTYDPFTGSYLQLDPLVAKTWSPYAYADGNPVGRIDPEGLETSTERCVSWSSGDTSWFRFEFFPCPKTPTPLTEPSLGGLFDWFMGRGGSTDTTKRTGKVAKETVDKPEPPEEPKKSVDTWSLSDSEMRCAKALEPWDNKGDPKGAIEMHTPRQRANREFALSVREAVRAILRPIPMECLGL